MKLFNTLLFFFLANLAVYLYGSSIVQKKVAVPNLVGLTVAEAKKILHSKSLDIGAIIPQPGTDSVNFDKQTVIKQNPSSTNNKGVQNYILKGQIPLIDLWVVGDKLTADTLKKSLQKTRVVVNKNSQ